MSVASSTKRTLESLPAQALEGLRALVRVDFNVPLREGKVSDATRIEASLPTVQWLRERGCRVVLLSHLGRPGGVVSAAHSLRPVADFLEQELGIPITFIDTPGSEAGPKTTRRLRRGEIALVENTRFIDGEESNAPGVADMFAALGDFFVNDAFGTAHRAHASTVGVAERLSPAVAGFLMANELAHLGDTLNDPVRPFVAVLGGAKISGKIDVIETLLPKVDTLVIGGAMACTFLASRGYDMGGSLVEDEKVDLARELLARAGDKIVLPTSATIARRLGPTVKTQEVAPSEIRAGWSMYDIGSTAAEDFGDIIAGAATVLWNGPMGVFETPPFDAGTKSVAQAVAAATARGAISVIGGGDSAAAVTSMGLADQMTQVSTGGGASLEFLEGRPLPGVVVLDDA